MHPRMHPRPCLRIAAALWALAGGASRRAGVRLGERGRTGSGIALHVVYSALLGAAYGVALTRGRLAPPARHFAESGLVYAAYLAAQRGASVRGRLSRRGGARTGAIPLDTHELFGMATSRAFRALLGM